MFYEVFKSGKVRFADFKNGSKKGLFSRLKSQKKEEGKTEHGRQFRTTGNAG
jgi:hypothetical protein